MIVRYGDTDSIYASLHPSKLEGMGPVEKVENTIKFAKQFQQKINQLLSANYSPDIQMAYEEVLFPTYFCAKK